MNTTSTLTVIATATAIAAGIIATPSNADARTYFRHHHHYYYYYYYGAGLRGTYARATRVYAADHYYRRPYQQGFNPDFQLGGNRSF